ncbi:hypothetical protein [Brucella intermedia]|uniref:hypothetical protein n=1 Tax=Brucella intermedia TaxID=94625 RepID=UPI00034860AC|nr:hypothetical protein [Brucella intermedia]
MTPDAIPQDIWELADKAHNAMLQADTHDDQIDIIAFAVLAIKHGDDFDAWWNRMKT